MLLLPGLAAASEALQVAGAASLRFALDEIVEAYHQAHPEADVRVTYGASGQFTSQIQNGAPYDIFLSADTDYPALLKETGFAASEPRMYAIGRVAVWSNRHDVSGIALEELKDDRFRRIAIASPAHAPYGVAAREALRNVGIWEAVEPKVVYGNNVGQTARMVEAGGADVGIIAASLAIAPEMSGHPHLLIDTDLHDAVENALVITRRAADRSDAERFVQFVLEDPAAHRIFERHGFALPDA